MNNNKIIIAIVVGCIIIGICYYGAEANKSASIERQQNVAIFQEQQRQSDLDAKNRLDAYARTTCVTFAQSIAIDQYANSPLCKSYYATSDCTDGRTYIVEQYDNAYRICLQGKGIK